MIVAIHQSNFLPWLGYFLKMAHADAFIYLDNVPFSKPSYVNRVKVKGRDGPRWLTVPVLTTGRSGQLIHDVTIDDAKRWREQHLHTLQTEYGGARSFADIFAGLREVFEQPDDSLARFNVRLLDQLTGWLALRPRFFFASQLGIDGAGSELLLRLVQAVGGDTYLSGRSGRAYLDLDLFERSGVEVRFLSFCHPVYQQLHGPFCQGLSTIDLLMSAGPQGARDRLAGVESRTEPAAALQGERP